MVAFLDALGTKGKWKNEEEANTYLYTWERIYDRVEVQWKDNSSKFDYYADHGAGDKLDSYPLFEFSVFSDTLLLAFYTLYNHNYLPSLVTTMAGYLSDVFLYALRKEIYFRGVVSSGPFYLLKDSQKSLLIGPAVDEAAEIYNQSDWIGISTAPSTEVIIENFLTKQKGVDQLGIANSIQEYFIEYPVPTKQNFRISRALAWPNLSENPLPFSQDVYTDGDYLKFLTKHLEPEKFQENPLPNSVYTKYKNTLTFYHHVKKLKRVK